MLRRLLPASFALVLCACSTASPTTATPTTQPGTTSGTSSAAATPLPAPTTRPGLPFAIQQVARISDPWAMTFLPDGRALVTGRRGTLTLLDPRSGATTPVTGLPTVVDAGQGGMHDIALGPSYPDDGTVYLSWVEAAGAETRGVVGRARLDPDTHRLTGLTPIWRQDPANTGGHYSLRLLVSPDGENLFVTSGERQTFTPAQNRRTNLGKILRLTLDGEPAEDNPFWSEGGVAAQIWSMGHRNPLGIAVDPAGNLWSSEMGPKGGDELNLIEPGLDYGWPRFSEGTHYDGRTIPTHPADGRDVTAPTAFWNPSISPANLMIYTGRAFSSWRGDAFLGGLSGQVLTRVDLDGTRAHKAESWPMGSRIREVEQGPDGSIWLLTDGADGAVLRLTPQ